jgi:hypothetical protein
MIVSSMPFFDEVCYVHNTVWCLCSGTLVSSTNKTDIYDTTEIFSKLVSNTYNLTKT